jgi:hypothetical protein
MGKNILRTDRLILIIAAILLVLPLTVSAEFITVDSITPNTDTNTSSVTSVTFTGTNFISGTDMPIVSGAIANDDFGLRYCTDFVTNSEIEAVCNFDLTGIPAGEYFVFVNDQVEASYGFLPFTVTSESEPTPTPTPTETIPVISCNDQTGNISLNDSFITQSSIGWYWDIANNITKISNDGLYVLNFDNSSNSFIGTGYAPSTYHRLKIYNDTEYGELNCTTTGLTQEAQHLVINPSTDRKTDLSGLLGYWWIPAGVIILLLLFGRK